MKPAFLARDFRVGLMKSEHTGPTLGHGTLVA
jgi:hypothetical protein